MKEILLAIFLVFFVVSSYAGIFNIGGKDIVITSPEGYSRVTKQMDAVYRLGMQMKDSKNDILAYYISDSKIPTAMAGEVPVLKQYFLIKVNKKLKNMVVSSKDFAEFKDINIRKIKEKLESIKKQIPYSMKEVSDGVSKEFNIDYAMDISQVVPFEPHYETENAIAYSMYINYGVSTEGVNKKIILSATTVILNVSGKVLYLYCYAPKKELKWTRTASKLWAEKVIDNNTQPPAQSSGGSVNGNEAIFKGIVGAVVGGSLVLMSVVLSIFLSIFKKRKKG